MARHVWTIAYNPAKEGVVEVSLLGRNPDLADLFGLIAAVGRLGQSAITKAEEAATTPSPHARFQPTDTTFMAPNTAEPVSVNGQAPA